MPSTITLVGIIILVIVLLGYIAYSQKLVTPAMITKYVPAMNEIHFPTGDIASMNTLGKTDTQSYDYQKPISQNSTVDVKATNGTNLTLHPDTSTLSTKAGQSFGQTSQFKKSLPVDTYQLGNPVPIYGTLKLVVPDSCVLNNGQTQCRYIDPPYFNYQILITCKIPENDNCAMDDLYNSGTTDGVGGYNYTFHTNANVNPGKYLITLNANSRVIETHGTPFPIVLQKFVELVK